MTKSTKVIAAADIGYGSVKAMLKGGDFIHMPSGAAPASMVPVRMRDGMRDEPLDVKGTPYLAGIEQDITLHQRHAAGLFAMSPDYHALFLETLFRLGATNIDIMVLGLPSREFETDVKMHLKDAFVGDHMIRKTKYTVGSVLVADQPIGTAALHYQNNEADLMRERLVVIDIGYGTCDIAMVVRGAVDRTASMSFNSAMKSVCEAMSRNLSTSDVDIAAPWIDECLRTNHFKVKPRGHGPEVDLILASCDPAQDIAQQIVNNTLGKIGSFNNVAQVVVTGGGAHIMGETIRSMIKGPSVTIMKDPVTANLLGFIEMVSCHG